MKITLFILTFIFSFQTWCCHLQLSEIMVMTETHFSPNSKLFQGDCSEELKKETYKTLLQLNGKIPTQQLKDQFLSPEILTHHLPQHISFFNLENFLKSQNLIPPTAKIKHFQIEPSQDHLSFHSLEEIKLSCSDCNHSSKKLFSIQTENNKDPFLMSHIKLELRHSYTAYKMNADGIAFSQIDPTLLIPYQTEQRSEHFFTQTELLKFYRLNKPIKSGEVLTKHHLSPLTLVKAGNRTEVIIDNPGVRLKTMGISRGSGGFGDWIEVFNQQKNKKYLGKIIDLNKVRIEL